MLDLKAAADDQHLAPSGFFVPPYIAVLLVKVAVPPMLIVDRNATMAPTKGRRGFGIMWHS